MNIWLILLIIVMNVAAYICNYGIVRYKATKVDNRYDCPTAILETYFLYIFKISEKKIFGKPIYDYYHWYNNSGEWNYWQFFCQETGKLIVWSGPFHWPQHKAMLKEIRQNKALKHFRDQELSLLEKYGKI